jgi:hypothetical protein
MHRPPSRYPRPRPESHATAFAVPTLLVADAVHHVESIEQRSESGHAAKNTGPALLEAFEHRHAN